MTIIGVIAALTIPNLMKNYQNHVWKTSYQRAYADVNNALKLLNAENYIDSPEGDLNYNTLYGEIFKKLASKFKTVKTCFNGDNRECWEYDGEAGFIYNGEPEWKGAATYTPAFIDSSGRAWYIYSKSERAIVYDCNGKKSPNKLGQDRMQMVFQYNSKTNNWTVNFWSDYTSPTRWCPSGKCYNKSWILNKK